jgi:hypothetical protein
MTNVGQKGLLNKWNEQILINLISFHYVSEFYKLFRVAQYNTFLDIKYISVTPKKLQR